MSANAPQVSTVRQATLQGEQLRLNDLRDLVEACHDWPGDSLVSVEHLVSGQRDEYLRQKIQIMHSENVY